MLGGTHQSHDYNLNINADDEQFIRNGCHQLEPGLEHAQHLYDWVGLKPGRSSIRLEKEIRGRLSNDIHIFNDKMKRKAKKKKRKKI